MFGELFFVRFNLKAIVILNWTQFSNFLYDIKWNGNFKANNKKIFQGSRRAAPFFYFVFGMIFPKFDSILDFWRRSAELLYLDIWNFVFLTFQWLYNRFVRLSQLWILVKKFNFGRFSPSYDCII